MTTAPATEKQPTADGAAETDQVANKTDNTATELPTDETGIDNNNDTEAGREIAPQIIMPNVEVLLLTADKALSASKIADTLGIGIDEGGSKPVAEAVAALNVIYEETGRTFRIEKVAGGYRLMTLPNFAETIAKQKQARASTKLSQAALEALAIVAYRQPLTRAEIEVIRGVACGEVLRSLLERHLVKIAGRAEEVGRPMLYGTTRYFLEVFGLSSLKDLPAGKELQQP